MPSWFPFVHLQHSVASRRKQGASIRIALRSLLFQEVHQPNKRIKADYLWSISDEVGKRVDIVKIKLAVAIIDDVLNAANFNLRFLHDALDLLDNFVRRRVTLNFQASFRRIHGACGTGQFLAAGCLANVRGAEIEGLTGKVDFDSVEKLAAYNLYANDMAAARRYEFLHQGGGIQAQIERACFGCCFQFLP